MVTRRCSAYISGFARGLRICSSDGYNGYSGYLLVEHRAQQHSTVNLSAPTWKRICQEMGLHELPKRIFGLTTLEYCYRRWRAGQAALIHYQVYITQGITTVFGRRRGVCGRVRAYFSLHTSYTIQGETFNTNQNQIWCVNMGGNKVFGSIVGPDCY